MLVDSHCHLDRVDLKPFDSSLDQFVAHAKEQSVQRMLCVSISLEAYPDMLALVRDRAEISVSVGVHPNETECHEPTVDDLERLAADAKVVAIGETGLDYFHSKGDVRWQHVRFRTHIHAAKRTGKPLIVHTRDAREDTLRILAEERAQEVGGVFHCFTEDWDTAKQALDLGFYISFSGIVTFRNAAQIQDVARKIPDDRYLVETDSPYLAPIPHRGKPNYPHYVRYVAEFIAELRGQTFDQVATASTDNYFRLFGTSV